MDELAERLASRDIVAFDRSPAAVYLAGIGPGGRRAMRHALDTIAGLLAVGSDALSCPWSEVRYQHAVAVRTRLAERYAPATVNKMLSALRGALKTAWLLGQMDAEQYRKAASVGNVKGETLPAGRSIARGELQALMDACVSDPSAAGVRDAAIIGLLYSCGLRVGELCAMDLDDYDPESGELAIRVAKRGRQRLTHVINGAADALADWMGLRGTDAGALFFPVRKGGHVWPGRLSPQAVNAMLQRRAGQASVKRLSAHDFRRTFVGDLLDAGADLSTVQKLAGHRSPVTTARYDRRPESAKREAVSLLHLPYQRRGA